MTESFAPNSTISHYRVISKLGAGGMGEVYLAHDLELDRKVAIKILPKSLAADQQRLQRFIQEAKSASALNHPHILTIYEIGTTHDSRFIATEFIDGVTLRQRVNAGMSISEILDMAIQVGGALAAAHAAGIIHRDIKPDNIMVRRDGYVKLLDFGLAKLADPIGSLTDTEAPTKALVNTDAGTVLGTATYMSPEQAKGIQVDERTDLWSLGAVLYEMVTGHPPFRGETPTETISLILQKEPPPLTRFLPDVPAELDRIVTKALTKDSDGRYQTAKDFLIDLRNLKRKLEVNAEIDRTVPPELRSAATTPGGQNSPSTAPGIAVSTATGTHSPSSAEFLAAGISKHKFATAIALVVLVVAIGGGALYWHARNSEVAIDSIAVLPFENQSADANTEYICEGLTDSIINSLTQLPNLKVIARSSVFRYKGRQSDPLAAAKELGVRAVLTGRLLQRGDNLTISTELIDARDNNQLWGEQYERKVSDLLTVQREIAREITSNLRLKISGTDQARVKPETDNAEAYQLYLKGRFYWNKRTEDGMRKSIDFFNQAIEKDPVYALAYAATADSWFTLGWYRFTKSEDAYTKSKAAALKALELDPQLPDGHMALALVKSTFEWDWAGAENEFKTALELNPKSATAHHRYSLFLPILGRLDEAVAEAKKAQELDPLSLIINENVGDVLSLAGRFDEAEKQLLKTIELDPSFYVAHGTLSRLYEARGMYEKALEEDLVGAPPDVVAKEKKAFAAAGIQGVWRLRLADGNVGPTSPFWQASLYSRLGEKDKAFALLNKAMEQRAVVFTYLVADSRFANLRLDPRYAEILKRVGLAH
ncbi:MAG: protein kinase [Pyrinomonadaceae bacterium]